MFLSGMSFDITDRRQAEEALRESQAQLSNMIGSAMDAIITIDSDQRIVIFNSAAEKMFRCPASEATGRSIDLFIPEASRARHRHHIHAFGKTGVTERSMGALGDLFALDTAGREFPIEASISQIEARGHKFYTVILRDITERKLAEHERDQLLAREHSARAEAETANRAKDEFLAIVSHDLRTPLNAIVGWATILRKGDLERQSVVRAIEIIDRNAHAQAQLIDDILDVSRIASGKLRIDARPVQLQQVIQTAVDSIRPAAGARNIRLQVAIDQNAGPVSGDPDRLQQVVWNLLTNALKFTQSGHVDVQLIGGESLVEIVVSDSGVGISAEFLPQVFDRFRQADGGITRRQRGLGLGLAIVRHLVELHGGTVSAHSDGEGKGSTFRVALPLLTGRSLIWDVPAIRETREESGSDQALDGIRILVVDDEEDARDLLTTMLSAQNAIVRTSGSAAEALLELDGWQPDILISDIEMPGMDGYSLIHEVRKVRSVDDNHLPAIALTAHVRVEDGRRALEAGFQVHLSKPIVLADLTKAVSTLAIRDGKQD